MMLSEKRQKALYDRAGNSPLAWAMSADQLFSAARILQKAYDSFDVHATKVGDKIPDEGKVLAPLILLYGLGLECLLKALWLKRGNTLVEGGKLKGIPKVGSHKLHELADAAGFNISPKERDALIRVSTIMVSSGRYPVAKDWNCTRIRKSFSGGYGPINIHCGSDCTLMNDLADRLFTDLGITPESKVLAKTTP